MTSVEESRIDPAVVAALYAEHAVELRAVLRGLLRDPHRVDDALQATFTKALQAGHTVQPGSHKAWLLRVAANEALVILRRQEVRDRALQQLGWSCPDQIESAHDRVCRQEINEAVRAALNDLPAEQRQVVHMRIYEGKTFATIARELNLPFGTVVTRMQLALRKLRIKLEGRT